MYPIGATAVAVLSVLQIHSVFSVYMDVTLEPFSNMAADPRSDIEHTNSWAVKLNLHGSSLEPSALADVVASELNLINWGQIGELKDHFLFVHETHEKMMNYLRSTISTPLEVALREYSSVVTPRVSIDTESLLEKHALVEWFCREVIHRRVKRNVSFNDPMFPRQWHLSNTMNPGNDINVTGLWEHNITGLGVSVAVIDDGLEWASKDILANYNREGSWDLNDDDPDPTPHVAVSDSNHHGTRCAGEIAAVANDYCAVGVAYGSQISGIRALDGPITDSLEAKAFNSKMQINDIYSCSWGPEDDGKTVDGPRTLAMAALRIGVTGGRQGYGSLFVVASGNGGKQGDSCSYDGYANSIYTITIGAVNELNKKPKYSEACSSLIGVTYSSGAYPLRSIVTTDWNLDHSLGCTTGHTGTSAAAPIAAGILALALQVRSCLSWRDIKWLIAITSTQIQKRDRSWTTNGAGLQHSDHYGFGLLNAWRLVNAAKVWPSVPWMTQYYSTVIAVDKQFSFTDNAKVSSIYTISTSDAYSFQLHTIEYAQVSFTAAHTFRGNIQVDLQCPSGMTSTVAPSRVSDNAATSFTDWSVSTVKCWGESPVGQWTLTVTDTGAVGDGIGYFESWRLSVFGSSLTLTDVESRLILVRESYNGSQLDLNVTAECTQAQSMIVMPNDVMSAWTLKSLVLWGSFFMFVATYSLVQNWICEPETIDEDECSCTPSQREDATNEDANSPGAELRTARTSTLFKLISRFFGSNEEHRPLTQQQSAISQVEEELGIRSNYASFGNTDDSQMCILKSLTSQNCATDGQIDIDELGLSPAEIRLNLELSSSEGQGGRVEANRSDYGLVVDLHGSNDNTIASNNNELQ